MCILIIKDSSLFVKYKKYREELKYMGYFFVAAVSILFFSVFNYKVVPEGSLARSIMRLVLLIAIVILEIFLYMFIWSQN